MLDLSWALQSPRVGAVLIAPYLGMESGTAIADTILGLSNPAGRLPITYYKNISAPLGPRLGNSYAILPNAETGAKGKTYRYYDGEVTLRKRCGSTVPVPPWP
eukprot:m.89028 g.89028  ORF g.89028 m.89028 type:complete len:103 (-) comp16435_c0_seq34:879-1187(-)